MTIVGSCGHTFTEEEDMGIDVTFTGSCYGYDGEQNTVVSGLVCTKCYETMKKENVLLSGEEEQLWMDGKIDRPIWYTTKC